MDNKYDFIVVGGGISGSSFAFNLDKKYKVLVIEKSKFPREKLCGGLLTGKTIKLIKEIYGNNDIEGLIDNHIKNYSLYDDGNLLSSKECNKLDLSLSKRIDLDNYMYQNLTSKGNIDLLNGEVVNINGNNIITKDGEYYGKNIVFCDGANGYGARINKKTNNKFISGLKVDIDKKKFNIEGYDNHLEIHFNKSIEGYIWVFSYSDIINVGIGGNSGPELSKLLNSFIKDKFNILSDSYKIKGHPVPVHNFGKKINIGNYYFLGDSIGFVDAITGEGIYYGIKSGYKLAKLFNKGILFSKFFNCIYFLNDIINIKLSHLLKNILFGGKYNEILSKLKRSKKLTNIFHMTMVLNIPYYILPFYKIVNKIIKKEVNLKGPHKSVVE